MTEPTSKPEYSMTDERPNETTTEIPDGVTVTPPTEPETPKPSGLWHALARAQATFKTPTKTKRAKVKGTTKSGQPYEYEYMYSSLDDLIAAVRPSLNREGVFMGQNNMNDGSRVTITTFFRFGDEVWTSPEWTITAETPDAQKLGSALTYARRHSMSCATGVAAEEDDDGQAAGENKGPSRNVKRPDQPQQSDKRNSASTAPDAKSAPAKPAEKPAEPPAQELAPASSTADQKQGRGELAAYPGCINGKQVKRMFSIAQNHHVSNEALKAFLKDGGISASDRIPLDRYDGIILAIQNGHVPEPKKG